MVLTNAEKQRRWRDKRNTLADEAARLRNTSIDILIRKQDERGVLLPKERRLAVQYLLKSANPKDDAELMSWLRASPYARPPLYSNPEPVEGENEPDGREQNAEN